jgi:hypothetical protein
MLAVAVVVYLLQVFLVLVEQVEVVLVDKVLQQMVLLILAVAVAV